VGARSDVRADRVLDAEKNGKWPSDGEVDTAAAAAAAAVRADTARPTGGAARPPMGGVAGCGRLAEADDALLERSDDAGLLAMLASRHVEKEVGEHLFTDAAQAGRFLSALAVGADASWPSDSPGTRTARQVRAHVITMLGEAKAAAVLRSLARDGRLYPGLAPPLGDGVVGTEKHAFSSREQLKAWVGKEGDPNERRKNLL
jgi:hypothetical protein